MNLRHVKKEYGMSKKKKNNYEMTEYDKQHYIQNSLFDIEIQLKPSDWYKNSDINKKITGLKEGYKPI